MTPCDFCTVLWHPDAHRNSAEYMIASYNTRDYKMSDLIPLDMESADELHLFKLGAYCLTSCHSNNGLTLRIQFVLQNIITQPEQKQYGVYQPIVAQKYKFTTVPYSVGSAHLNNDESD